LPKKIKTPEVVVQKVVSLEEMINKLIDRVQEGVQMSLSQFAGGNKAGALPKEQRLNMIVGFLAMLELVKQGMLTVEQNSMFEDIHMESVKGS